MRYSAVCGLFIVLALSGIANQQTTNKPDEQSKMKELAAELKRVIDDLKKDPDCKRALDGFSLIDEVVVEQLSPLPDPLRTSPYTYARAVSRYGNPWNHTAIQMLIQLKTKRPRPTYVVSYSIFLVGQGPEGFSAFRVLERGDDGRLRVAAKSDDFLYILEQVPPKLTPHFDLPLCRVVWEPYGPVVVNGKDKFAGSWFYPGREQGEVQFAYYWLWDGQKLELGRYPDFCDYFECEPGELETLEQQEGRKKAF